MNCKNYKEGKEDCERCKEITTDELRDTLACWKGDFEKMIRKKLQIELDIQNIDAAEPEEPFKKAPETFESYEEAIAAKEKKMAYEMHKKKWGETLKKLQDELKNVNTIIIGMIPFRNSWIKVLVDDKQYGVGYRMDAWGGDHAVLEVHSWTQPMPNLEDRMQYN